MPSSDPIVSAVPLYLFPFKSLTYQISLSYQNQEQQMQDFINFTGRTDRSSHDSVLESHKGDITENR